MAQTSSVEKTERTEMFEAFIKLAEEVFSNATKHRLELPIGMGRLEAVLALIERADWSPEQRAKLLGLLARLDEYTYENLQFEETARIVHPVFLELQAGE